MSQPPNPPRSPQGRHRHNPPPPPQQGHGHGQPPRYAPPPPPRHRPAPPPTPAAPRQQRQPEPETAPTAAIAQQSAAEPRRRRKWPWILGAVVLLFVVIGIANGGQTATAPVAAPTVSALPTAVPAAPAAPAQPAEASTDEITFEVIGEGVPKANNITYIKDSNFSQQQENGAELPWRKTIEFENGLFDAQPLSLVAQSGSGGSGSITCRILRNGQEVTSSTSSGPYAVVTCSGGLG